MKVLIVGYGCSGKTTYGLKLARTLNVPILNIDKVFYDYSSGTRITREPEDVAADVLAFLKENDSWVIDGGYDRTGLFECCSDADSIVFMRINKLARLRNLAKRCIQKRNKKAFEKVWMFLRSIPWIVKKGCDKKYDEYSFSSLSRFPGKITEIKTLRYADKFFGFIGSGNRPGDKTVYLTFDDGPSEYTEKLLEVLGKYNVKASFFVTASEPEFEGVIKKESSGGHTVGVHCFSHKYNEVYADETLYFADLEKMQAIIEKQTGQRSGIVRLPGGSSNTVSAKYKKGIMSVITKGLKERGYRYFDWNVSGRDSIERNPEDVFNNVLDGISGHDASFVLLHDTKPNTPYITEKLIRYGIKHNYVFLPITDETPEVHHRIANE